MRASVIFALSLCFAVGLTLQSLVRAAAPLRSRALPRARARASPRADFTPSCSPQSCVLYHNYWPLLTGVTYVIAPMPVLFLAGGDQDAYARLGGGADSWEDMAKFLVGARRAARRPPREATRADAARWPLPLGADVALRAQASRR